LAGSTFQVNATHFRHSTGPADPADAPPG